MKVDELPANLHKQLSNRRIERYAGRAVAVWHMDQQVAEVVRKDGKFENFGFSAQGKLYLEYYETLFLLELVRTYCYIHCHANNTVFFCRTVFNWSIAR